jgi:hypothetical protein
MGWDGARVFGKQRNEDRNVRQRKETEEEMKRECERPRFLRYLKRTEGGGKNATENATKNAEKTLSLSAQNAKRKHTRMNTCMPSIHMHGCMHMDGWHASLLRGKALLNPGHMEKGTIDSIHPSR